MSTKDGLDGPKCVCLQNKNQKCQCKITIIRYKYTVHIIPLTLENEMQ
jgi:hypothetical protein